MKVKDFAQWYCLPFIGGILYVSGFPNLITKQYPFFLGPILGYALLFSCFDFLKLSKSSFRKDILIIFLFSLGANLFGYYWVSQTLNEFGGLYFPFNTILWILFSLIIFPQVWVSYGALCFIKSKFLRKTLPFIYNKKFSLPVLHIFIAALYTFIEQTVPQQFPAFVGHPFISINGLLGAAHLIGAIGYSFIGLIIAFSLATWMQYKKKDLISLLGIIPTLFILCLILPNQRPSNDSTSHNFKARIVQANIGNFLKVSSEQGDKNSLSSILNNFLELSLENLPTDNHLIIWPETSYPYSISSTIINNEINYLRWPFSSLFDNTKSDLFFGGYILNDTKVKNPGSNNPYFEDVYNSAILLSARGKFKSYYNKHLLIPFGETLPFGPLNKIIGQFIENISFFARGEKFTEFKTKKDLTFISAICYEILFPEFMRSMVQSLDQQPSFIINLTNDSWFGDTAEPYQHLYLSRWRALELNLPILRSTNTGISSYIDVDGQVKELLGLNQKGYLDLNLSLTRGDKTLYQKGGYWISFLLVLSLFALVGLIPKKFKSF